MARTLYTWGTDERTATVTTPDGVDSRLLTPYLDITAARFPLVLECVVDPETGPDPVLDFVHTGMPHPRILSERALSVLERFLVPNGALTKLSIRGVDTPYYAFTPRHVLDVIDESRSRIKPTSYGRYLSHAALRAHPFAEHDVFVVKGFEESRVFVTDSFVRAVGQAGLEGAAFEPTLEAPG
jgi:hypothetical protein